MRGGGPADAGVPAADVLRSLPKVGVDAALCRVTEEMEEVLSARARGAKGGGLPEIGGLKGRDWKTYRTTPVNVRSVSLDLLVPYREEELVSQGTRGTPESDSEE